MTVTDRWDAIETRTSEVAVPRQPSNPAWFGRLMRGIIAGDILAIAGSLGLAHVVFGLILGRWPAEQRVEYLVVGVLIGAAWLVALSALKSRARRVIGYGATEYQRVINATLVTFGLAAIVCYVGIIEFARGYVAIALPLGMLFLVANRAIWRRILLALRRADRCFTGAVIIGSAADVDRTVAELGARIVAGYRPIGVALTDKLADADPDVRRRLSRLPRIAQEDVVSVTKQSRARALMIAGDLPGGREQIRELGWAMENSNAEMILVSRLMDVAGPRVHLRPVAGLPMVHVQLPQYTGFNHALKRCFDVVASALALAFLAPVFLVIAVLVRREDRGPAFFRQTRVGVGGSTFTMLKFRSMVMDAEVRLAEIADANEGSGVLFKMKNDPRVTKIGAVLRRFSLDELPQLWNVFRGDMSLVGPRPPLLSEVESYRGHETRRLLTKPGITGLWQVSGRSDLSWDESVRLDLYYVENWSMTTDLVLLVRTVIQMFKQEGAY